MDKAISPLTQMLRKNNNTITLVLLSIVILFIFPVNHFIPYDIKSSVETELKTLMDNPWIKVLLSILVFATYQSGNTITLALLLYVIHHIAMHK